MTHSVDTVQSLALPTTNKVAIEKGRVTTHGLNSAEFGSQPSCHPYWMPKLPGAESIANVVPFFRVTIQLPGGRLLILDHFHHVRDRICSHWNSSYFEYILMLPTLNLYEISTICGYTEFLICHYARQQKLTSNQETDLTGQEMWSLGQIHGINFSCNVLHTLSSCWIEW